MTSNNFAAGEWLEYPANKLEEGKSYIIERDTLFKSDKKFFCLENYQNWDSCNERLVKAVRFAEIKP